MAFDKEYVERVLVQYPVLEIILQSGVVSMKMSRDLMHIDRWLMQDLYSKLLVSGAVKGVSTSAFRATPQMLEFLKGRDTTEVPSEGEL